jgi:CheY-like chemotaxis protein
VLVAASDPGTRRALLLAFASDENRVYAAVDGAEALALAHQVRPELALVDLRLARVPGYEVAMQLRRQYGRTVSVVAIGEDDPEDRARALAAGFDEHLAKPITQEALAALLESYLSGRASNRVRGLNRDTSRSSS